VISIGIDGGSWEAIKNATQAGRVSFLANAAETGCSGTLQSLPPITYPQWYVLLSGLNPGRIGVYGFLHVDKAKREARITRHSDFHGQTLAERLSRLGTRFAVINTPGVVPRDETYSGYIVGDPFSPKPLFWPPSLAGPLKLMRYQNYDMRISKTMISQLAPEEAHSIASKLIQQRFRLASYILRRDDKIRFIHITVFTIDNIQHFYGLEDEVTLATWSLIDRLAHRLYEEAKRLNRRPLLLFVSDHGFTNIELKYNIAADLLRAGLVTPSSTTAARLLARLGLTRERLASLAKKPVLRNIAETIASNRRLADAILARIPGRYGDDVVADINMKKTKVLYANNAIYILEKHRREEIISQVKSLLANVAEETGGQVNLHTVEAKKVFEGDYMVYAPDLLLLPRPGLHVMSNTNVKERLIQPRRGAGWVADHTVDAMLVAWSEYMSSSCRVTGRTMDYAATLLELLGLNAASSGMDGAPLTEIVYSAG